MLNEDQIDEDKIRRENTWNQRKRLGKVYCGNPIAFLISQWTVKMIVRVEKKEEFVELRIIDTSGKFGEKPREQNEVFSP